MLAQWSRGATPRRAALRVFSTQREAKRRDGTVATLSKTRGFLDYERSAEPYRPPAERLADWGEINLTSPAFEREELKRQTARCMDCGTPFCQTNTGCPIHNIIPEFNSMVFEGRWRDAYDNLRATNNFPEFTGRVCPAPCEGACVAGLIDSPVTIKNVEYAIIDKAFAEGWVLPEPPRARSGKKVAVVGSGPAGLAAADMLNRAGHLVTVYERDEKPGGLLMYGIPNMKLEKDKVQRRLDLLEAEGIRFKCGVEVGVDLPVKELKSQYDALLLTVGSTLPNDLKIPGRELEGVHFAMEFLRKNQYALFTDRQGKLKSHWTGEKIDAKGKNVIVIGGGDTGTDCIGTSLRMHCKSLVNFELFPRPPDSRAPQNPWPAWPRIYRTDYGHEEAAHVQGSDPREYSILSKGFHGKDGKLTSIKTVNIRVESGRLVEIDGSEKEWPCDLVILAMGFKSPEAAIAEQLSLELDGRANFKAKYGEYATSVDGVFAAGDCRRGQSLVVWAINEGREAANKVHSYLSPK
ncbi:hypothetical protein KFE25_002387 [Diacronema lutheri]|uniref:Glutamate synthase n=2 Tax=Diacronema lutheri TaxID=2081491 RepID=A0A8J6CB81_DIALT|nr:hypothetical protein KFE25_002387 [Diacronema lutheri]